MIFIFILTISTGLFVAGVLWLIYLALEPYVRRHWPQTIITWTRMIDGRWRDPLVGRDLLFGVILGVLWTVIFMLGYFGRTRAGSYNQFPTTDYLLGFAPTISTCLANIINSIFGTMIFFFALVLLRVLLKNRWLAAAAFVFLFDYSAGAGKFELADSNCDLGLHIRDHRDLGGPLRFCGPCARIVYRQPAAELAVSLRSRTGGTRWILTWWWPVLLAIAVWGFYTSLGPETVINRIG